jgi:acetyl esterase/lipase
MHLLDRDDRLSARAQSYRALAATRFRHLNRAMRWPWLLMPLFLGACSPAGVLNALAPNSDTTVVNDIAYGQGPRQKLDVYAPKEPSAARRPVVIFIYGGNWDSGDRAMYRFVGANLAAEGAVIVIPDYRLYPEIRFPAFMDDAAQSVAWTRAHATDFGGDPDRIFLMGHSAGGHIAALLALDRSYLQRAGVEPRAIAGVVGLAGPYDFLPLTDPELKTIFGPESEWPRSQPINFVTPGAPPMLLLTGDEDDTVRPRNSRNLAARLQAAGDTAQLKIYPGIGHLKLIGALARPITFLAPVKKDVMAFISATPSRSDTPSHAP